MLYFLTLFYFGSSPFKLLLFVSQIHLHHDKFKLLRVLLANQVGQFHPTCRVF